MTVFDRLLEKLDKIAPTSFRVVEDNHFPFITYVFPSDRIMRADGKDYYRTVTVDIELYTNGYDHKRVRAIYDAFESLDIAHSPRVSYWIETEKMFKNYWTIELQEDDL